jgi:hypothetical protein
MLHFVSFINRHGPQITAHKTQKTAVKQSFARRKAKRLFIQIIHASVFVSEAMLQRLFLILPVAGDAFVAFSVPGAIRHAVAFDFVHGHIYSSVLIRTDALDTAIPPRYTLCTVCIIALYAYGRKYAENNDPVSKK